MWCQFIVFQKISAPCTPMAELLTPSPVGVAAFSPVRGVPLITAGCSRRLKSSEMSNCDSDASTYASMTDSA